MTAVTRTLLFPEILQLLIVTGREAAETEAGAKPVPIKTDKEGNEISLLDIIESPPVDIVEEYSTRQDIRFLFSSMKDILTPKEYQVICCRYGLFENNEMTQREIADQLHISRSYVSRIEKNALKKLKTLFG